MTYNQLTTDKFVKKAKTIHGNKYDYSKVKYVNNHTKVCIICPIHGEFWQTPMKHLIGRGCPKCGSINRALHKTSSTRKFIEKVKAIYGDKYDYSKVEYKSSSQKVCIICPKHGEFWQTPNNHLRGHGCAKCQYETLHTLFANNTENFVKKAKEIHGNKYDYSKTMYKNSGTKVCIICPIHGEFWQRPANHLLGIGCPLCQSSKLEKEISVLLETNNIDFIQKYHSEWLGRLELDFYLPQYKIGIECQGKQHFKQIKHFDNNKDSFETRLERDERKLKLCAENDVKLLYYSSLGIEYPYKVFEDKKLLLKEIRGTVC